MRCVTYFVFVEGSDSLRQVWPAFWLGFRFDARVVAAALLPLVALGAIPILDPFRRTFGRRLWLTLLTLFSAGLVIFYVSDFLHYRYLGQRLNASALGFLVDTSISLQMVWESYPVIRIFLGMVVVLTGLVWAILGLRRRASAIVRMPGRKVRVAWYVLTGLGCAIVVFGRLGQYPLRWSDAFSLRHEVDANLALNPVESFTSSLSFRAAGYETEKVREHYTRMASYLGVAPADRQQFSFERRIPARPDVTSRRPPNIVLVLCESFSAYKSSMWGNPLDTTPFFNDLARQGVFFDNCYTPHIGTARGVWALITGIPDVSTVETASRNPAMVDQHTIVNDFKGYEKFYFLGGSSSWANIRGLMTNNIGGLKLYEEDSYDAPRLDVWGISDKNLFFAADKVLRQQTKPFLAIIQTADNHRPYTIPAEDLKEFQKVEVPMQTLQQNGFGSLAELNAFRYTDFAFKKFMEAARQAPYYDNTIFVFVGDHGIGGYAGPPFPSSWTENHLTRFHVPLLFYGPKFLPPQRLHAVASLVDILPTVAGLANISYRNPTLGRDLFERQQADGGAGNMAFIMDHNDRTIGVVKQPYYGVQKLVGGRHNLVWADFASPTAPVTPTADHQAEYQAQASAFYETARALLLNNKKTPDRKGAAYLSPRTR